MRGINEMFVLPEKIPDLPTNDISCTNTTPSKSKTRSKAYNRVFFSVYHILHCPHDHMSMSDLCKGKP